MAERGADVKPAGRLVPGAAPVLHYPTTAASKPNPAVKVK